MLFNNFSVTQAPSDISNLLVMRNPTPSNYDSTVSSGGQIEESLDNGDFLISAGLVVHVDWSILTKPLKPILPHFTAASTSKIINLGYEQESDIDAIPSHVNTKQSPADTNSTIVPSSHVWVPLQGAAIMVPPGKYGIPFRACGANLHNGSYPNNMRLMRRAYADASGDTGNLAVSIVQSCTMFFVYHPSANGDSSGLGLPAESNAQGDSRSTFVSSGEASTIAIKDTGVFTARADDGDANIDIDITAAGGVDVWTAVSGAAKLRRKQWDINYYLSGDGSRGDGSSTKEAIIWCVDIIQAQLDGVDTMEAFTSFKTSKAGGVARQHRIDDHTSWWNSYFPGNSDYNNGVPQTYSDIMELASSDVSGGIYIYNQYGVLVGHNPTQDGGGIGKGDFSIGELSGATGRGTHTLHGYNCETIITPQPLSMKKKHLILKHLRTKWGISDSYSNGKPFHD